MFNKLRHHIPTFRKIASQRGPSWYVAPWWPGESLAIKQKSLLHVLAACHQNQIAPSTMIEALMKESRGVYRRTLRRLLNRTLSGMPLVDALEQTPDALDDASLLALRLALQSGTLTATYEMLLRHDEPQVQEQLRESKRTGGYWIAVSFFLVVHLMLFFAVIGPTFAKIYDEFGMPKPYPLVALNQLGSWLSSTMFVWLAGLLLLVWVRYSFTARRVLRRSVATRVSRTWEQRRRIELLDMLGLSMQQGRPVATVLSTLARYHFDRQFRLRLLYARNELEQGADTWQSLVDARLLSAAESAAIEASPTATLRSWTLRKLASVKRSQQHRDSYTRLRWLQPLLVLGFALVVLFIAWTYFITLSSLIAAWA